MDRAELHYHALHSKIFSQWHWFQYHFRFGGQGHEHPLVESILDACLDCEAHMPGFAKGMIEAIAEIGGKEKHEPHYEQLLQLLAELLVIRRLMTWQWPKPVTFEWEPTAGNSKKNPEVTVRSADWVVGVEVKAPSLFKHMRERGSHSTQVPSRIFTKEQIKTLPGAEKGITLPRDNPVKDFLISANGKFAEFHRQDPNFFGVLVIVWDDFIFEPITALVQEAAGLFTPNSFARDGAGNALTFTNLDAVFLIRQLHQFIRAARAEPLIDNFEFALDYGEERQFPWKVEIPNPAGRAIPPEVVECLQAVRLSIALGAEYEPSELIFWTNSRQVDASSPVQTAQPSQESQI